MSDLLPCPFCGSTKLESGGDDKFVGVRCLTCEATGPNHYRTGSDWGVRTSAPLWLPIATAPKEDEEGRMIEIMIAGGTYYDSGQIYGKEYPLKGWTLACFDKSSGEWQGDNSGTHDEFYYYKPTHWMHKIPGPTPPSRGRLNVSNQARMGVSDEQYGRTLRDSGLRQLLQS